MSKIIERIPGLRAILSWLMNKFGSRTGEQPGEIIRSATAVDAATQDTPAVIAPQVTPRPRKSRKTTEIDGGPVETLGELLDRLDATFASLRLPSLKESWLDRDSRIGLRKLGVHVPHPGLFWFDRIEDKIKLDVTKKLPAIMSMSMAYGAKCARDASKTISPEFFFAIKHRSLPAYVSKRPGVPYQFGFAVRLDGNLFWMHCWIVVDPRSGEVCFCDELRTTTNVIPLRNPAARRAFGGHAQFVTRSWTAPRMLDGDVRPLEEQRVAMKNMFRNLFDWWVKRDERWSVAVKKDGERITFGVDKDCTKEYFANRDKTVKTASGKTKPIIHFVQEHDRDIGSRVVRVKAHVRGLREFDWSGYHCVVTAPSFTGYTTAEFDVPAYEAEESDLSGIPLSKVGKLLAEFEDKDIRAA